LPASAQGPDPVGSGADATTAVNYTWTLVAGFLVFFMQAGFALVEAGRLGPRIRSIF
jgi:Amt family ammonium transporter